jgi:hypothetical protein
MKPFVKQTSTAPEPWLLRLRAAYRAGFYKTESAVGKQERFPWQGKTCGDCPFWSNNQCSVFIERRSPLAHTCCYFDRANRAAARELIEARH